MCGASVARARTLGRRLDEHQGWRPAQDPGATSTIVQRCTECGLVFANPMPLPADIEHHYGIPAEDYWRESELAPLRLTSPLSLRSSEACTDARAS